VLSMTAAVIARELIICFSKRNLLEC
jgi:hypothetical protein